jgi:hypothetical protein
VTATATSHWRELARRTGSGVEVALLLSVSADRVKVAVSDGSVCHHVDLMVDDAVTTFERPFAHAAERLLASDRERGGNP